MSSTQSTVTIDIVSDAAQFRQAMKEAASDSAEFVKKVKKQNDGLRSSDKAIRKAEDAFRTSTKKERKEALRHEKDMQRALLQKSKVLGNLHKQGKKDTEEAKKLRKEIIAQGEAYAEAKKQRELDENYGKSSGKKDDKSKLATAAKWAVGAVGAYLIASAVKGIGAVDDLQEAQRSASILGGKDFKEKIETNVPGMEQYGVGRTETTKIAADIAKLTGKFEDVLESQKMSFASGMSQQQQAQFMGTLARGGITSDQGKSEREQTRVISNGMANGFKKARLHEIFSGITSFLEAGQQRVAGDVSAVDFSDVLKMMGTTEKSGLQGARGAATLQQVDAGLTGHAMNSPHAARYRQALGYGPGGDSSFFGTEMARQEGLAGKNGKKNLYKLLENILSTNGGYSERSIMEFSEMGNINLPKAKDFLGAYVKSKKTGNSEKFDKFYKENEKSFQPIDEQIRDILDDKIYKAIQADAQATNKLLTSMDPLHEVLQKVQAGLRDLANVMLAEIPALITVVKDLTDAVRPAIKPIVEFFGGEMPQGSDPSPLKNIIKETTLQKKLREKLEERSREDSTPQQSVIKEIKTGKIESHSLPGNDLVTKESSTDLLRSMHGKGPSLGNVKLPNISSPWDQRPPSPAEPTTVRVEGSLDLTTPDGTRKIVPLKQTSAPTTKINNGRGIR